MATGFVCSVAGCEKPILARGWCGMHYQRWSIHGDVMWTKVSPTQAFLDNLMAREPADECLIWPFSRNYNGYGKIIYEGGHTTAHRVICKLRNGPPPTDLHEAAHSCGNGASGCVNPSHLSWKTHAENSADRITHGTSRTFPTSPEVVRFIRNSELPIDVLAQMVGKSRTTVHSIRRGRVHRHIT